TKGASGPMRPAHVRGAPGFGGRCFGVRGKAMRLAMRLVMRLVMRLESRGVVGPTRRSRRHSAPS
ncbi:hypothetical protein, partial [Burkholderia pseudomallei]|uniref:hypothetical protein n=1 Tax=Burkholderia pseudomallei TaxID=28450 RepID=UPI001C82F411